jgi:hypothetical protein
MVVVKGGIESPTPSFRGRSPVNIVLRPITRLGHFSRFHHRRTISYRDWP